MPDDRARRTTNKVRVVLLSTDATFTQQTRSAFDVDARFELSTVDKWLHAGAADIEIDGAAVAIVDLDFGGPAELSRLQNLAKKAANQFSIIVVLREFNETTARALLQLRVADMFTKPVASSDLVRGCVRLARAAGGDAKTESNIHTFLPVMGGAGTTTLAIQSAMTLLKSGIAAGKSTCLIDLNFNHGACVEYLDLDPRLDLAEIEPNPARLDRQLLDGMVSPHASGLAVIAAVNRPSEIQKIDQNSIMSLLNVTCQCFDQIVIDMPKTWQAWTDNVILGSTRLYLVSNMSVPGIRRAKDLVDSISTRLGHGPSPKVLVNRFERQFFATTLRKKDFAQALGDAFAGTVPENRRLVREAIDLGVPLDEVEKGSNVAGAIKRLLTPRTSAMRALSLKSIAPRALTLAAAHH